ncbi:MAG TPA: enoyl-CoA hydratase/isomerase family protein [Tepidiformaceae bacterium]|nr:enoyl-CoA hydratase/isomerase family protein [Tepidiformaceae bacterium]
MTEPEPLVRLERMGAVAEMVLSRPARKNAITGPLVQAASAALAEAGADAAVGAILVRGEGGSFCSGLDLKEFNADPRPEWLPSFQGTWRALHEQVFAFDKPIVCALEGFAINAGSAWALSSDFIVVGESAFLQVAEVRQGRPAPMNLAWLRLRYGDAIARRVALLGRKIPGAELARLGIALECVPDAEVLTTARDLAAELAAIPAQGLAITKSVLRTLDLPGGPNEWFQRTAEAVQGRSSDRAPLPSVKSHP